MGLIRVILALSVVASHSGMQSSFFGTKLVDSSTAVEAFFIISGFYMSIILTEKYVGMKGAYSLFVTNRFLRLFPTYWLVLILSLAVCLVGHYTNNNALMMQSYFDHWTDCSFITKLFLILTNLFVFGQDTVMFLGLNISNGHMFFAKDIDVVAHPLWTFILVPQAWTIGLELMFYLIAPFLVRLNSVWLLLIMLASLLSRLVIYNMGLNPNPWSVRFFPSELVFFLAGIMTYRFYRYVQKKEINKMLLYLTILFIIGFSIIYKRIKFDEISWVYCICIALAIPFIFLLTKRNKFDREFGELSYPIYIVHWLLLRFVPGWIDHLYIPGFLKMPVLFCVVIAVSFIIVKIVVDPLEKLRQRRVAKAT